MITTSVKRELISKIKDLNNDQQRRLLDFVCALTMSKIKGIPGKKLLAFSGAIPAKDLKKMEQIIENNCESIDRNEW